MNHMSRMLTSIAVCIALLALAVGNCCPDATTAGKADTLPFWQSDSSQPMSPALKKNIDALVRPLVESSGRVGVVVGIIDGDKKWVLGYGRRTLGKDIPPDADTVYEIGSVTKTFTAAALAIMSEKKQISLKDPVSKFLPKSVRVPSFRGQKITLEHLATQTSGLPTIPDNLYDPRVSAPKNPYGLYSAERMYGFLGRRRLENAPGKKYEYSNLGVGLLGLALSRARGCSYESMVTSLICKPLGMNDTVITLSNDQRARLAPGYTLEKKGGGLTAVPVSNWTFQDCFAGAGALRSTANDMLRYLAANLGSAETPLKQTLQSTHKVRHKIDGTLSVGLAWHVLTLSKDEPPIVWHNGGTGGYSSFVAFCKERKVGVVLLSNTTSYGQADEGSAEDAAGITLIALMMNPELMQ